MRKPEDVPAMYNQAYVDHLKSEIQYWKDRYAEERILAQGYDKFRESTGVQQGDGGTSRRMALR